MSVKRSAKELLSKRGFNAYKMQKMHEVRRKLEKDYPNSYELDLVVDEEIRVRFMREQHQYLRKRARSASALKDIKTNPVNTDHITSGIELLDDFSPESIEGLKSLLNGKPEIKPRTQSPNKKK